MDDVPLLPTPPEKHRYESVTSALPTTTTPGLLSFSLSVRKTGCIPLTLHPSEPGGCSTLLLPPPYHFPLSSFPLATGYNSMVDLQPMTRTHHARTHAHLHSAREPVAFRAPYICKHRHAPTSPGQQAARPPPQESWFQFDACTHLRNTYERVRAPPLVCAPTLVRAHECIKRAPGGDNASSDDCSCSCNCV